MTLVGQRFNINYVVARSFYALGSRALGITMDVEGEEYLDSVRPAILVGNHQSMLDILYLGRIFPKQASIMAKKELLYAPLLGQYMLSSGAVFVDRGNNKDAVRSLAKAGEAMKSRKTSIWVFPEGTTSSQEYCNLLPFKKGAFHLAVQSGIPIIPVVCENYWRLYHQGVFESGHLKIKVLPPITTEGLTAADVSDLANRTRDSMLASLSGISTSKEKTPQPQSAAFSKEVPVPATDHAPSEERSMPSIDVREARREGATTLPTGREGYRESKVEGSETSSVSGFSEQTEEDDGMVLVGRPGSA